MRKRKWVAVGLLAIAAAAGFYGYHNRKISVLDAINPAYWVRRWRGDDLYDASTERLLHGNRSLKEVAITIDDGPHSGTGDQLLDILKRENARATFFVVGINMKKRPDIVRRMLDEGHEVANHTYTHYRLSKLRPDQMRREINDNDINFYRITGKHFDLLRPPGVNYNLTVSRVAKELGYQTILVNVLSKDFDDQTPDYIVDQTLRRTENGSIILLHDDRMSTVLALPRIIEGLRADGYKFVTVSEMLAHLPKPVIVESNALPDGERKLLAKNIPAAH
jgi:peptidoglycan/xylan/chitin deacetylase (PgdA/CDA1 family)